MQPSAGWARVADRFDFGVKRDPGPKISRRRARLARVRLPVLGRGRNARPAIAAEPGTSPNALDRSPIAESRQYFAARIARRRVRQNFLSFPAEAFLPNLGAALFGGVCVDTRIVLDDHAVDVPRHVARNHLEAHILGNSRR